MEIVFKITLISLFHFIFSIFLVGLSVSLLLENFLKKNSATKIGYCLQIISLGIMVNLMQFCLILLFNFSGLFSQKSLVVFKYFFDLFLILMVFFLNKSTFIKRLKQALSGLISRENLVLLILSLVIGWLAISSFPHVYDSGQLKWTNRLIQLDNIVSINRTGFGFSALIYFPRFFSPGLPLGTTAAGFKLPLLILVALTVIYISEKLKLHFLSQSKFFLFCLILFGIFGLYGIIMLGKDSQWGIIFSLLYMISLVDVNSSEDYFESALFLGSALSMGMITIPYLSVFTVIFLLMPSSLKIKFPKIKPLKLLMVISLIALPILILIVYFIARHSIHFILFGFMAILLLAFFSKKLKTSWKKLSHTSNRMILITWLLLAILLAWLIMPLALPIPDSPRNPIDETSSHLLRTPLDGRTTFWQYFFSYKIHGYQNSTIILILGMVAIFFFAFHRERFKGPALRSLALFPFSTISIFLIIASYAQVWPPLKRMEKIPFTPFLPKNIWDIVKDVPQWYMQMIAGIFIVIMLDHWFKKIKLSPKLKKIAANLLFLVLIFMIIFPNVAKLEFIGKKTHFFSYGGNKNFAFAAVMENIHRYKHLKRMYFIDKPVSFKYYGLWTDAKANYLPFKLKRNWRHKRNLIKRLARGKDAMIFARRESIVKLFNEIKGLKKKYYLNEIAWIKRSGEGIYVLSAKDKTWPALII